MAYCECPVLGSRTQYTDQCSCFESTETKEKILGLTCSVQFTKLAADMRI